MNVQDVLSRIDTRLKAIGMSKEEFYQLSGISSATYSHWNTGKYRPTLKKLRSAAQVLGVSYEYLVTGVEAQKEQPAPPSGSELSDLEYIRSRLPLMSREDLLTLLSEMPQHLREK